MRILHRAIALFRALFRSARVDADLAEEMRFHVERETQANVARGMPAEAARRAARLTFGRVVTMQEQSRDERPGAGLRGIARDVSFGARLLGKSPGFALTGVAIVALGIGATTAVFSVVYGVLLRPLAFREPERLVTVWLEWKPSRARTSPAAADVLELRQLRGVFDGVALFRNINLSVAGDYEPRRLLGGRVSANIFSVLGVSAAIGRTFTPDEEQAGREHVVLLSHALWRGHFGGDSGIVGRQIRLNGTPYAVVGVLPPEFRYPTSDYDAWVPNVLDPRELTREATQNYRVVARLDDRATLEEARLLSYALAERIGRMSGSDNRGFAVDPMLADAVRGVRPGLTLLLGAVSLLLLIACVNLSNLCGARARARRAEFAVRLAIGASRQRLIAQACAESVPVLVLGGILGVALAAWAVRAFVVAAPAGIPRLDNVGLNTPVLVFSFTLLILIGIMASVAPAVQAWSLDCTTTMKDGGRSSTGGRGGATARRLGVAAQLAFALPLLAGASLLFRSVLHVMRVDPGFSPERVATVSFEASRVTYVSNQEVGDYYARVIEAVRAAPGVADAALGNRIPLLGSQTYSVSFETAAGPTDELVDVDSRTVSPGYFTTLGIRLITGRTFSDHDGEDAPAVAIVDDRVAQSIWPGETAIGKRLRRGMDGDWATVIGVVGHVHAIALEVDPRPQVYWSYRQWVQSRMVLTVRSRGAPDALFAPVIQAMRSVDPDQAVYEVRTMTDIVDRSLAQRRVTTALIAAFGGIAVLLVAVGIYGVIAYGVSQRMREFGIRVALGATARDVTRLVVWQGTSTAIAGAVVGLVLAIAAAGVMRTLVYGVAPRDVASLGGAAGLLMLVACLASYIPARGAARVDPGLALRAE